MTFDQDATPTGDLGVAGGSPAIRAALEAKRAELRPPSEARTRTRRPLLIVVVAAASTVSALAVVVLRRRAAHARTRRRLHRLLSR